jgi:hypothetical protein
MILYVESLTQSTHRSREYIDLPEARDWGNGQILNKSRKFQLDRRNKVFETYFTW